MKKKILIDKDSVIKLLEQEKSGNAPIRRAKYSIGRVLNKINQLPTVESEWINTSDRKPNYGEFILFCVESKPCEITKVKTKTIYLGWRDDPKELKEPNRNWFCDSSGKWFEEKEVIKWYKFPDIIEKTKSSINTKQGVDVTISRYRGKG